MLKSPRLTCCFCIMQFSYWAMWSSSYSFAGMYLSHNGMSYTLIGITMSASVLSGILGQLFWGCLCDRLRTVKKVFLIANILIWADILLLCNVKSDAASIVLMALLGFSLFPQPAILDSWILNKSRHTELNYGFVRMWASIGYAMFAFVTGIAINRAGYYVIPVFSSVFLGITIATALLTPDIYCQTPIPAKISTLWVSYRRLLTDKHFVYFLSVCFLIGLGLQVSDNLMPLIVESVGGTADQLGLVIFSSAITEIPFFFLSVKIQRRFSGKSRFRFAICIFAVKFAVMLFASSPLMLACGMTLQGIGYAIFLPCMRLYAYRSAPSDLRISAQTIADCVTTGFAGSVASFFGGAAIQHFGFKSLLTVCFALTILSLFISESKSDYSNLTDA